MFYFCHSKNPSIFNSISIYYWKKGFLSKKYKKQMCYKEIYLYFLTSRKMAKFFLQKFVISNMITDYFLVEIWGTLERARRYVCKNLLNLNCQDSIYFDIFKSRVFPSHFLQNVLIETSNVYFKKLLSFLSCTLSFLNAMKFIRFKTH